MEKVNKESPDFLQNRLRELEREAGNLEDKLKSVKHEIRFLEGVPEVVQARLIKATESVLNMDRAILSTFEYIKKKGNISYSELTTYNQPERRLMFRDIETLRNAGLVEVAPYRGQTAVRLTTQGKNFKYELLDQIK